MAVKKMRRSQKRRAQHNALNVMIAVLFVSGFFFLISSLFLRNFNNDLSTQAQEISSKIAVLETQNDAVRIDIQTLGNYNRVEGIASEDGMKMDPNNIITISAGASSDGE